MNLLMRMEQLAWSFWETLPTANMSACLKMVIRPSRNCHFDKENSDEPSDLEAIFRQSHVKTHGGKARTAHRFPQRKSIPMTPVDPS